MRVQIVIPKGWRRVTSGKIRAGDRYASIAIERRGFGIWEKVNPWNVGAAVQRFNSPCVIRRVADAGKGGR